MASFKCSLLFAVTTSPEDLVRAAPHSGGWSESHWRTNSSNIVDDFIIPLAQYRALMLPSFASIIGYRVESFTISGNKLLPGGSTSGRFLFPGGAGVTMNIPQDSLQFSANVAGQPNSVRFNARCLPDDQVSRGEYQPTPAFRTAVQNYTDQLRTAVWGTVFVDKSQPTARVNKIVGNVVTLSAPIGAVAGTSYVKLLRVYDDFGRPVKGSFLATAVAGNDVTLQSLSGHDLIIPSGLARVDVLLQGAYAGINPTRAVSRKIGRPFEQYRGRRSTLRV